MIKYFYYEEHIIGDQYIVKNEKILDSLDLPESYRLYGWYGEEQENVETFYIDVEKRIKFKGSLDDDDFKKVYDKLLIQERNLKLETL